VSVLLGLSNVRACVYNKCIAAYILFLYVLCWGVDFGGHVNMMMINTTRKDTKYLLWGVMLLLVGRWVVEGATIFAYNSELAFAEYYLDKVLPTYASAFNWTTYNGAVTECQRQYPKEELTRLCQLTTTREFAKVGVFWDPLRNYTLRRNHPLVDCKYSVEFVGASAESNSNQGGDGGSMHAANLLQFEKFEFHVQQNCSSNARFPDSRGSTFDVFAYTDHSLATCTTSDHQDGKYSIVCEVPMFPSQSILPGNNHCIYLTVNLEHEHYDTFSLALESWTDTYPNLREVLVNNVTYCASDHSRYLSSLLVDSGELGLRHHFIRRSHVPSPLQQLLDRDGPHHHHEHGHPIVIYSGVWMRHDDSKPANIGDCSDQFATQVETCHRRYDERNCHPSWIHDSVNSSSVAYYLPSNSSDRYDSLSMWIHRRGCFYEVHGYKVSQKKVAVPDIGTSSVASDSVLPSLYSFRPLQLTVVRRKEMIWTVPTYKSLQQLRDGTTSVQFYGASHMRYLFMGMIETFHGASALISFDRKITSAVSHDFSFTTSHYADELAANIQNACKQQQGRRVFVLQAGDWDLSVSISRVFKDPRYATNLVNVLTDLLEGRLACPRVQHVVFVTGLPYPMCNADADGDYCADQRCFRTNTAIAAMNTHILQHLLNATLQPGMKLSVVDAYSIVSPRIMMNENVEIGCANHFSCAVQGQQRRTYMIHGRSGMAVLQALLHALSN
jgi:hypothetical protein